MHGDKKKKLKIDKSIFSISDGNTTLINFQNSLRRLTKEDNDFCFENNVYHLNDNVITAGVLFGIAGAIIATAVSEHENRSYYRYELSYLTGQAVIVSKKGFVTKYE